MSLYKQQRQQIRDKIINNAIQLFSEKGYENILVDDITKSVGIAKGTFYNFFSSKSDILTIWAEQEFIKQDFISVIRTDRSIEENLIEFIRYLVKAIEEKENLLIPFLKEMSRLYAGKQAPNESFDFIKIFTAIIQNSADFKSIGEAYFDEKIIVLNNSLFISLIGWFNKGTELNGLEQQLFKMAKVCLYGILKNQE